MACLAASLMDVHGHICRQEGAQQARCATGRDDSKERADLTTQPNAKVRKRIIVLHAQSSPEWRWITQHMPDVDWTLVRAPVPRGKIRDRLGTFMAALRAVRMGRQADLVVSLGPGVAAAMEIGRRILRVKTPHIAYFLNFTTLPRGLARLRQAQSYRTIDRLVVSSVVEEAIYADHFGIDPARFETVLWGVNRPHFSDQPVAGAPYICAIGGNARDYGLLMAVAAARPHMRFIVVVRPHNLVGLTVPSNVETKTNIPYGDAMAVVKGARIMALPLQSADTPCGHVTIVGAQYLDVPIIATASTGVEDYIRDGETGLLVDVGSAQAMGEAIDRLWAEPATGQRLADAARAFVEAECNELNYVNHLRRQLALAPQI